MPAQSLCGSIEVPEDHTRPAGRRIALRVAVLPALDPDAAPDPLVLLAGGPGQGAVEAIAPLLPAFTRVRRHRDLVLVDQRGTGESNPLDCSLHDEDAPLAERLGEAGFPAERLRECLAGWSADVRHYTTMAAVADLVAVLDRLGYRQANLWGGSYGTRLALALIGRHPERVRAAILDGVAPYENRLPLFFARDGQRALDLLFEHCAADAACATAYPDLAGRFAALLQRLRERPEPVVLEHPVTGERVEARVSYDAFVSTLRGVLYAPDVAVLVPWTIDQASRGNFEPMAAQALALESGFSDSLSLGLFFSVVCAEDVPFITSGEVEAEASDTFFGTAQTNALIEVCRDWPRGEVPEGRRDPIRSDVPILMLSGELDPATPPVWAEVAGRTLTRSVHVVVPGVGHGATSQGCVPELIDRFLTHGDPAALDTSCVARARRPPFFVSFAGPVP